MKCVFLSGKNVGQDDFVKDDFDFLYFLEQTSILLLFEEIFDVFSEIDKGVILGFDWVGWEGLVGEVDDLFKILNFGIMFFLIQKGIQ